MDISSNGIQSGGIRDARNTPPVDGAQRRNRAGVQRQQAGDEATISEQALLLQKIRQEIADSPDVREEKVAALRDAVDKGIYRLSPREIARAMLGSEERK